MPIRPIKYAQAAGIGAAHVGCAYLDTRQGWVEPFRRSQDYPQLIGFILGLIDAGLEITPGGELGETIAIASIPLLMRSIYEGAKYYLKRGSPKRSPKQQKQQEQQKQEKSPKGEWRLVRQGATETGVAATWSSY